MSARRVRTGVLVGAALVLSACSSASDVATSTTPTFTSTGQSTTATTAQGPPTTANAPTTTAAAPTTRLEVATSFGAQSQPCTFVTVGGQIALPDPSCTPGAVNGAVTQSTIGSTICMSGYSSSIRPSESVTYREKRSAMAAYRAAGSTADYEYDHLVSLELGGAPNASANLWPEPYAGSYGARVKDRVEDALHRLVCTGSLTLAAAQDEEAGNWVAAYQRYVGPLP